MMLETADLQISLDDSETSSFNTAAGSKTQKCVELTSVCPKSSLAYLTYFYAPHLLSV